MATGSIRERKNKSGKTFYEITVEGEKDILAVIVSGDKDKIGTDTIKVRYV